MLKGPRPVSLTHKIWKGRIKLPAPGSMGRIVSTNAILKKTAVKKNKKLSIINHYPHFLWPHPTLSYVINNKIHVEIILEKTIT